MPTSEKARRAGFAELDKRERGGKKHLFKGMGDEELEDYLHKPLHKKKPSKGRSSKDQAKALRSKSY